MPLGQRLHQAGRPDPVHGGSGCPDAGEDDSVHPGQVGRGHRNNDPGSPVLETLCDGDEVSRSVIDDGDPGHMVPLVLGMPSRRESSATAFRNARASALNAASAT